MTIKLYTALLLLICSCTGWTGWDDVPTAKVTAKSELPMFTAAWETRVAKDVELWNSSLTSIGCPAPFELADNGHSVVLVQAGTWDFESSIAGMTSENGIKVQVALFVVNNEVLPHPVILLHELGHAIGLNHSDSIFGPSAMTPEPTSDSLLPRDIEAAACSMGCGPCTSVDHYDD